MKVSMSALFFAVGFAGASQAATITWGAAQDTAGPSDVVAGGAVALALDGNVGPATPNPTVAGVSFTSADHLSGPFAGLGPFNALDGATTGDAAYDSLINENTIGGGPASTFSITGLTDGVDYFVQVWFTDLRDDCCDGRTMTYGDGNGNTVDVNGNPAGANGGSLGQYAVGQFTASGTTQDLTLATSGFGQGHFSALLVREVPEPGSLALLGLGGLMVARRRRG